MAVKQPESTPKLKALPAGIISESESLAREVVDFTIENDSEYEYWASRSMAGAALVKKIESYHDDTRSQAYKLWKSIVKLIEDSTVPIKRSVAIIDRALGEYKRAKFQKAEAERQLLQKQAEVQHDELVLAEAQELEKRGEHDQAAIVLAAGVQSMPVVTMSDASPPKVKGFGFRQGWDFEYVDAFGKTVSVNGNPLEDSSLLPREYLMPNDVAIRKVVNALGLKTNIPGIRVKAVESTIKRRS